MMDWDRSKGCMNDQDSLILSFLQLVLYSSEYLRDTTPGKTVMFQMYVKTVLFNQLVLCS